MSNEAFLPADYQAPSSSNGNYTKLQTGETRVRILSNPATGYVYWNNNNKPVRVKNKPSGNPSDMRLKNSKGEDEKIKHFWALVIFNYATRKIELWEITQASIQAELSKYSRDSDWGHPKQYDVKVNKSGSGLDTVYTVVPAPKAPVTEEVKQAWFATPIDLEALFIPGADPFSNTAPQPTPSAVGASAPAATSAPATAPAPVAPPAPAAQSVPAGRVEVVDDLPF